MPLVLRKNLTKPLTHVQLDGNFEYLEITSWTRKAYEFGQMVFVIADSVALLYLCVKSHTPLLYHGGGFRQVDEHGVRYWAPLSGGEINDYVIGGSLLDGTQTLHLIRKDGVITDTEIDLSMIATYYSSGITTNQFLTLSSADLPPFSTTYELAYIDRLTRTDNTIVINLSDADDTKDYFLVLPNGDNTTAGARARIILKSFQTSNPNKKFYVKVINIGEKNRLLCSNLNMYVSGIGYFLPLDIMNKVDVLWDGNDWLVTNYIKAEYVTSLATPPIIE